MVDVSQLFPTSSDPVASIFSESGLGFYIPRYQRQYSWNRENIDQLMEDICHGVENLRRKKSEEIRFLGTIIRVTEHEKHKIQPQDPQGFPTRIDNIIDGQQRICTIALLASLLYQRIDRLSRKISRDAPYGVVHQEIIPEKIETLEDIFTVNLRRGKPPRKPIVIRGAVDTWTKEGDATTHYVSDVAGYLAQVITAIHEKQSKFPTIPQKGLVGENLRRMNRWLGAIESIHSNESDLVTFPTAWDLLQDLDQASIWSYDREDLQDIVADTTNITSSRQALCSLVQLLAFTHYLLNRCCFTIIDPTSEDWAFDMFQSLNATGTPLTAIETFKPLVVNITNTLDGGYHESHCERYFQQIDDLFREKSAVHKSRLTDEYLTALALANEGKKLSTRFSEQRKWLSDAYNACTTAVERQAFVHRMGDMATYFANLLDFTPNTAFAFPPLAQEPNLLQKEKELATLCVLYLEDNNHKMARTILGRLYSRMLRGIPQAAHDFVAASKAIAAFYTLWRATQGNSGLDQVYRHMLRKSDPETDLSWSGNDIQFSINHLKHHLRQALEDPRRDIGTYTKWSQKAVNNLNYQSAGNHVCRFVLFVIAQNTIADPDKPGLLRPGTPQSTTTYLTPEMWDTISYKTVEHIAPQKQSLGWDEAIYIGNLVHTIGNLTLLPGKVNTSAGDKDWKAKWIYYHHLAEKDQQILNQLERLATEHGVDLNPETLTLLRKTEHNAHMIPLVEFASRLPDRSWDAKIITDRTEQICELLWKKIYVWLADESGT